MLGRPLLTHLSVVLLDRKEGDRRTDGDVTPFGTVPYPSSTLSQVSKEVLVREEWPRGAGPVGTDLDEMSQDGPFTTVEGPTPPSTTPTSLSPKRHPLRGNTKWRGDAVDQRRGWCVSTSSSILSRDPSLDAGPDRERWTHPDPSSTWRDSECDV